MTDIVDRKTRSRMMAAVRGRDTGPELALRRAVVAAGGRGYRLHRRDVPGSPDLVWMGKRVAVFVDGAFWHGHRSAFKPGKSGRFWDMKIARNMERDREVSGVLRRAGWAVLRFWDFQVEDDPAACAKHVIRTLRHRKLP